MITMIAALAHNRVIGDKGQLPWRLPDDLKHFKAQTQGKPVIMGRLTYESLGKPLPNRLNVVLSQRQEHIVHDAKGVVWCPSIDVLPDCCPPTQEWMVIGGGQIYTIFLPYADRLVLTNVDAMVEGDCHFPVWQDDVWCKVSEEAHPVDEKHAYAFRICTYERSADHPALPLK